MKPYGLPRDNDFEWPDKSDLLLMGASSSKIKMHSKTRRGSRRFWAKHERRTAKSSIRKSTGDTK